MVNTQVILVFLFGLILGYPNREAAHEALKAVRKFLDDHADKVIFCLVLLCNRFLFNCNHK